MANNTDYPSALRAGTKEYRACLTRGEYPYLPVLDDILADRPGLNMVDLGPQQIPAEFVVGTKTSGRTTAFARNFMPLLAPNTEFAMKWEKLCQAHLNEGIRDSVKVYEYLNRYYVQEGNKRVSVLKYFGAVSIPAIVTRVMPPKNDSTESKLYYEYLDFNRVSEVNYIWCTRLGSYKKLLQLLGKKPQEKWTTEEQRAFQRFYYYFRQSFESLGGKKLPATPADAMLVFLNIYSYGKALEMSNQELRRNLTKIWEEVTLLREEKPIELVLNPEFGHRKLLGKLTDTLSGGTGVLKVAFVHDKDTQQSGWTYLHELGRRHVDQVFQGRIQTKSYFNALEGDPAEHIREAVKDGADLIFTTTPRLLNPSLAVKLDYPDVIIMNCSLNTSHRAIRTYYARAYEAKFVTGAVAGAMAKDGKIGFICDYPIYGMIAGINAFALGAQMVNPEAKIYLEWMNDGYLNALQRLQNQGIRLISGRDMTKLSSSLPSAFGLFYMDGESKQTLAMPVWHWGPYYEYIIRSVLNRTFLQDGEKNKAQNYWWGMSSGVVDVICSERLPGSVHKLARLIRSSIQSGEFHPFDGVLKSQNGIIHGSEEDSATPEEIITMDWLAENVVGELPSYQQLSYEGKATVDVVGVEKVAKQAEEEQEA
ncbi:MAG: BMP family ABC transporter substrate-binding protein [Candidatus Onthomonas sp.]